MSGKRTDAGFLGGLSGNAISLFTLNNWLHLHTGWSSSGVFVKMDTGTRGPGQGLQLTQRFSDQRDVSALHVWCWVGIALELLAQLSLPPWQRPQFQPGSPGTGTAQKLTSVLRSDSSPLRHTC